MIRIVGPTGRVTYIFHRASFQYVEDVDDIRASVKFAKQHQLNTTVKNTGHDLCVLFSVLREHAPNSH